MPRRRMIGPEFWDDEYIGKLTDTEKLAIVGCVGNADDDGRLKGSGEYLKAAIFMYDNAKTTEYCTDLKATLIDKMASWPVNHPYRILAYKNGVADYLFFPNWAQTNKPSHPTSSKLPAPPPETLPLFSGKPLEIIQKDSGGTPSQVRSGQSSLGKVRVGQDRGVLEDFTKYLDSEKDLTDLMTTTLEQCLPRGPTLTMPVIQKLWRQATGKEMDSLVFQVVYTSLQKYPAAVLARSLVKAAKYSEGKNKPAKYIQVIFDEQMKEYEKDRSP